MFQDDSYNKISSLCAKGETQSGEELFRDKKKIGIQCLVLALVFMLVAAVAREWQVVLGISLGLGVIFVNYVVIGTVIDHLIRSKETRGNPIFCLLAYLLRFWILVVFLYIMFTLWGTRLGLSIVAGMSIIKITAFFDILEMSLTDRIYPPNVLTTKKLR